MWPLISELVATHRTYGDLPLSEYDAFVDMLIDELAVSLGTDWTDGLDRAWRSEAGKLKQMIAKAQAEWELVLPR